MVGKLTKHLQHPFKENLPWWCMIELGRKLVFLQLLIPFPQNTVSFIIIIERYVPALSCKLWYIPYNCALGALIGRQEHKLYDCNIFQQGSSIDIDHIAGS